MEFRRTKTWIGVYIYIVAWNTCNCSKGKLIIKLYKVNLHYNNEWIAQKKGNWEKGKGMLTMDSHHKNITSSKAKSSNNGKLTVFILYLMLVSQSRHLKRNYIYIYAYHFFSSYISIYELWR